MDVFAVLLFQLLELAEEDPGLVVAVPDVPTDAEEDVPPFVEADPPINALPVAPEPEEAIEPEVEPPAFISVEAVEAEALMPVLVDVLLVFRVLLQFASKIARGNTKNVFFIN